MKNKSGFSLIELLISMMLMVVVSATIYAVLNMFFNVWDKEYRFQHAHEEFIIYESALREDVLLAEVVVVNNPKSMDLTVNGNDINYEIDINTLTIKRNGRVLLRNIIFEDTYFSIDGRLLRYSAYISAKPQDYGRSGVYALK